MQFDSENTETVDEEVLTAGQAAMESGRMTPLLKVELWAKIQSRRLSEGKPELQVQFNRTPRTPLTDAEKIRQKDRRESNRMAAQKCRRKKKETKCKIEQIREELEEKNRKLKAKLKELEEEKQSVIGTLYEQQLIHVPHTIEPLVVNEAYTLPLTSESTVAKETHTPPQTHVKINSVESTLQTSDIISRNEEDEELRELWYFHSSQEVPTSSSPPQRSHTITTPHSEVDAGQDEDMMDDKWLACSFVNLDDYLV